MGGDTEVIRDFLVSLGFQIDETGRKKFLGAMASTEVGAAALSKSVIGIGIAAEAMVVQFSSQMEKLYYASRRTHASVENIQALEFGSQKIGIAAGVAREALEGMAAATRMNPGLRGLLDGILGKSSEGMDQAEAMIELVQKLSEMPHYQGAQFAQMFGIDEKTFLMLKDGLPELIAAEKERRELNAQAGIDAQQAAKEGREYANSIRDITTRLGVLRDRMAHDFLPTFREVNNLIIAGLDGLAKFRLDEHPTVKKTLAAVNPKENVASGVADAVKGFKSGDKAQMWRAVKELTFIGPASRALGAGFDAVNKWRDSYREGGTNEATAVPPSVPLGMRQNNPGNLRNWGAVPVLNGFAQFQSPKDGLSAMAGNLVAYYNKHGLHNIRSIIARYAPTADRNDTAGYINDISKRMGVDAGQTLDLKNPDVLAKLMRSMVQHEQGYNPFGASEYLDAARSRLGGAAESRSVVLNQKTEINVHGASDARAAGGEVARSQERVNSELARNMSGAIR
jgi:hypothetical protein